MSKILIIIVIILIILAIVILCMKKTNNWSDSDTNKCKEILRNQLSDLTDDNRVYLHLVDKIKSNYSFSQFKNEIEDDKFPNTSFGRSLIKAISKYNSEIGKPSKWNPFMQMLMLTCISRIPTYKNIDLNSGKLLIDGVKTKFNFIKEWLYYSENRSLSPDLNNYVLDFIKTAKFVQPPFSSLLLN